MKTYWIWSWSEAVKGIFTLCSGIELSTQVVIVLRIILLFVESYNTISLSAEVDGKKKKGKSKEKRKVLQRTVGARLPDINRGIRNRLASLGICHSSMDIGNLSIRNIMQRNGATEFSHGVIMSKERTQNSRSSSRICCICSLSNSNIIHQSAHI